jgi:hypothetical protein
MNFRIVRITAILILLLAPFSWAQTGPSEYEVKAAFIYNFAKFVTWPNSVFRTETAPLIIGILGDSQITEDLRRAIENKTAHGRPISVLQSKSLSELYSCQIIIFNYSTEDDLKRQIEALRKLHILTIGESEAFFEKGGIIRLFVQENKVRFAIDTPSAEKAGLSVSSKLLKLATPLASSSSKD